MNKYQYIHLLDDVKLILGNGYDLHCRLHSSYGDYLLKNRNLFEYLKTLIDQYKSAFNNCVSFYENKTFADIDLVHINLWDLVFATQSNSYATNICWFDVESLIQKSLDSATGVTLVSFPNVLEIIQTKKRDGGFYDDLFASFISNKYELKEVFHSDDFYNMLLDELKEFEYKFGLFIQNQRINLSNPTFSLGLRNERFDKCADLTIKLLCNPTKVVSVDNFNYDDCGIESFSGLERNVNGNVNAPIFGVDSVFLPHDPRIMFSKTHRRLTDDMDSPKIFSVRPFKNIIVYGHSLDSADYSYFFPIFDKLQLTDNTANSVIVFAFTIYDKSKENDIKITLNKRIYKIIEAYAEYKGFLKKESVRLVDHLSIQRRIIMYEIPEITDKNLLYQTFFDSGFEKDSK